MLQWDTVAIPFSSGIKPNIQARLLDPQQLLTAQNCYFPLEQGPFKRNGHAAKTVRTSASYPGYGGLTPPSALAPRAVYSTDAPGLAAQNWLFGYGIYNAAAPETNADLGPFCVSSQPNAGLLFGTATRDNEVLGWDGHRLFSYAPQQATGRFGETVSGTAATAARGPAVMPAMRTTPIAKIASSQVQPCAADNGVVRAVAWINAAGTALGYSAYDSTNGAALVVNQAITLQGPKHVRILSVGQWFHIIASDTVANSLIMRSFHQDSPGTLVSRALGATNPQFDVKKIDEAGFVVARKTAGSIFFHRRKADGSLDVDITPNMGGLPSSAGAGFAIEVDADKNIGMAWFNDNGGAFQIYFQLYDDGGTAFEAAPIAVRIYNGNSARITCSPRVIKSATGFGRVWDVFNEDIFAGAYALFASAVTVTGTGGAAAFQASQADCVLASHAFRVGNRNYLWLANRINNGAAGLQYTWFLADSSLKPIGKTEYGTANTDQLATLNTLSGVNWVNQGAAQGVIAGTPFSDRVVFHGALGFNQRVATVTTSSGAAGAQPSGVFTESGAKFYQLDFLPPLRACQVGRTTYFAGAQLWAYDGAEVVEAGFHTAPEVTTGVASAGGSLSAGDYRYRIDICHKNAQGEEVRSWSIISAKITAAVGQKITVTVPYVPMTRREDAYMLIFRTEANGTIFYLTNSRDPLSANFVANGTVSYVDTLADASLNVREYHPANAAGNYLDPLPAPACEIVAAGRNRLWLAGGELAPGELAPSRLFAPNQTPAFTPALNIQVDRNAEPITAVSFAGDIAVAFRRTSAYIVDSDGPDNSLNGAWADPRLALVDSGAIAQEAVVATTNGIWFQSTAGIRLLNPGGGMDRKLGYDIDPVAAVGNYAAAVVIPKYGELRWYSRDPSKPTLVYNYLLDAWSTWTVSCVGAVFWPTSSLAVVAKSGGDLWVETEGLYNDGGASYEMVVRTAWLHGGQLGDFQRVRRFALFGFATAPLTLRARLFYDERDFHDEEMTVVYPASGVGTNSVFNTSAWGTVGWGFGTWGDAGSSNVDPTVIGTSGVNDHLWFRDSVFRFRRRPAKQKCSVFSVEFSDQGALTAGFVPVVLGLEIGKKTGLDRIPTKAEY